MTMFPPLSETCLLGRVMQCSRSLGAGAHALHRRHHIVRLVVVRVAQIGRPLNVFIHLRQNRREGDQRFHAGIPVLLVGSMRPIDPAAYFPAPEPSDLLPQPEWDRWRRPEPAPPVRPDKARSAPPFVPALPDLTAVPGEHPGQAAARLGLAAEHPDPAGHLDPAVRIDPVNHFGSAVEAAVPLRYIVAAAPGPSGQTKVRPVPWAQSAQSGRERIPAEPATPRVRCRSNAMEMTAACRSRPCRNEVAGDMFCFLVDFIFPL